jgi:hypothetical protein
MEKATPWSWGATNSIHTALVEEEAPVPKNAKFSKNIKHMVRGPDQFLNQE